MRCTAATTPMRGFTLGGALSLTLLVSGSVRAEDPLNSNNLVTTSKTLPAGATTTTSFNLLPVAGGNTDIGFGAGYFAGLVREKRSVEPFVWNLESAGFVTFDVRNDGGPILPYQDIYLRLTVPRFEDKPMRLVIMSEYTWETLSYYGLGNASSAVAPPGASSRYFDYVRVHPTVDLALRVRLVDHIAFTQGLGFSQNWIQVVSGSRLEGDLKNGDAEVKRLLGPAAVDHPVAYFKYGLQWDDRDNEVSTTHGTFDDVTLKLAPGAENSSFLYRYAETTVQLRAFAPLFRRRLVLAMRAVGDVLVGDVPFYELSRYADTYAIGGVNGVRGVPGERYSGRVKVFGNFELRCAIAKFILLKKNISFGAVGFFDGGRVWADTRPEPALDGTAIGLKYGTGVGLRFKSDDTFVIRLDAAWSPDAKPIGAYIALGELF